MLFLRRLGSTKEGGSLRCPACQGKKVRFVENLGCQMEQWRCGDDRCGQRFRYQRKALPMNMPTEDLRERPELVLGNRGPSLNSSQVSFMSRFSNRLKGA